ncbi:alpha/beta fold hydrolase [Nocardioides sp. Root151]|uniref:alpha/beta fold hydrolase n=1 Tax=Nocardioides sp. Root151 TaxID=1736475 RepID=UPI000703596F|nr:alpha/beta hydrolase [Nocardioides sp. Root151]KQZ68555.1 hypothetical protein ASD66_14750 [Nocardioides sp. Root151]
MSVREHVRTQRRRLVELVALLAIGALWVAVIVVGAGFALAQVYDGRTVAAVGLTGGGLGLVCVGALLVWAHFTGNGRVAHTDTSGHGGREVSVVSRDGTRLHVEVDGPDDAEVTVVFVHGWTCQLSAWRHQRRHLAGRPVRSVYYDQRGHGRSDWIGMGEGERGVRHLADDLDAVVAATAPTGRLVLVGHSMGGMTIMASAQRHPEVVASRVDGVLFCGTAAGPLSESMALGLPESMRPLHHLVRRHAVSMLTLLGFMPRPMARLLGVGPYLFFGNLLAVGSRSESAKQVTAQGLWDTPLPVAGRMLKAVMTHDERDAVPSLDPTRVVVVSGKADRLVPYADQLELARLVGDARVVGLEGIGHMVAQEAPDVVNAELDGVLALAGVQGDHEASVLA